MKFVKILLLFILFSLFSANSQDKNFLNLDNGVGLKLSNISGYGFYYNRKITNEINIQLMGLIYYYYNQNEYNERTNINYDIGLEFQNNFFRIDNFRGYFLLGAYYYFDDDKTKNFNYSNQKVFNSYQSVNNSYNIGVGIGFEYYFKRFVISADLGYKYFEDSILNTDYDNKTKPELHRVTKVGAGIGIGFMF